MEASILRVASFYLRMQNVLLHCAMVVLILAVYILVLHSIGRRWNDLDATSELQILWPGLAFKKEQQQAYVDM